MKLYYFSKLRIDDFPSTPGVADALQQLKGVVSDVVHAELSCSVWSLSALNVFSLAESALLLWVSIHYTAQNAKDPRVFASVAEIQNPSVFISIIRNHVPSLAQPILSDHRTN
jgi:hypothetical protein